MSGTKTLKLLYLPLGHQPGLSDAFGRRPELAVVSIDSDKNLDTYLIEAVSSWQPDIIHVQSTDRVSPETIQEIKAKYPQIIITQWLGDQRHEPLKYVVEHGRYMDLTLLSNKGQIPMYLKAGCRRVDYWQHAANREIDFMKLDYPWENRQGGIVFCGHNYDTFPDSQKRLDLCKAFSDAYADFRVYGRGWDNRGVRCMGEIPWYDQVKVYHPAKLTLGIGHFNDIECGVSDRPFIAMASGTCHLSYRVPGMGAYFENGKDWITFENVNEALHYSKLLLSGEALRRTIGAQGRKRILTGHTWDHRVTEYFDLLTSHNLIIGG